MFYSKVVLCWCQSTMVTKCFLWSLFLIGNIKLKCQAFAICLIYIPFVFEMSAKSYREPCGLSAIVPSLLFNIIFQKWTRKRQFILDIFIKSIGFTICICFYHKLTGNRRVSSLSQVLFQMLSWRLPYNPIQLRSPWGHIILQTPFFPALQGERELQPPYENCIHEASSCCCSWSLKFS